VADKLEIRIKSVIEGLSKEDISKRIKGIETEIAKNPIRIKLNVDSSSAIKSAKESAKVFQDFFKDSEARNKGFNNILGIKTSFKSAEESAKIFTRELGNAERQATTLTNQIKSFQQQMNIRSTSLTDSRASKFVDSASLKNFTDELNKLNINTPNVKQKMSQLRLEFQKINSEAQSASNSSMHLGESLKQAALKFPLWVGIGGAIMSAIHGIQNAVKYIVDMDTALTNLSKVVDLSSKQMLMLRDASISVGKELGQSSVSIMQGMSEWARFTKQPEEIMQLTKVATMAANVTDLTVAEASKALTTIMLAYKVNVKDAGTILDQFNEIQNKNRTSARDLADAISTVGASAKQAGIPIQQLEGFITALVSSTGVSGQLGCLM